MRSVTRWIAALFVATLVCAATFTRAAEPAPRDTTFRVTLLGTGSPQPLPDRFGPGVLVQVAGQTLLIDCGRGVTQRLQQVGVPLGAANRLFLTHLHSDHIVGIPDLWLTGWLEPPWGRRKGPLEVFGPMGTAALMSGLKNAFDWDIRTRIADQNLAPENVEVNVREMKPGVVYERDGVTVTAIEVDHGEKIKPAFGFRVDYGGRAVVVSGDTRFSENLIERSRGADLLIHQVASVRPPLLEDPAFKVILDHHTKPEEAGTVFSRVKPKLAVFYHFVLLGTPKVPPMTVDEVVRAAAGVWNGPIVAGKDLMSFELTGSEVRVREPGER